MNNTTVKRRYAISDAKKDRAIAVYEAAFEDAKKIKMPFDDAVEMARGRLLGQFKWAQGLFYDLHSDDPKRYAEAWQFVRRMGQASRLYRFWLRRERGEAGYGNSSPNGSEPQPENEHTDLKELLERWLQRRDWMFATTDEIAYFTDTTEDDVRAVLQELSGAGWEFQDGPDGLEVTMRPMNADVLKETVLGIATNPNLRLARNERKALELLLQEMMP